MLDPHLSLVRPVAPRTAEGCAECLQLDSERVTCACARPASLSAAAAHPRSVTPAATRSPWGTRSSSRSSPARTGGGATWTRPTY